MFPAPDYSGRWEGKLKICVQPICPGKRCRCFGAGYYSGIYAQAEAAEGCPTPVGDRLARALERMGCSPTALARNMHYGKS